ncbi:helix-turn-helix domain-containing protein [Nocardia sp. SYP-A9097]|uniref:MarR family winged helix-turn-helix transcriptional regulator n=1 Tax=Nocardia sp. SYP-A9097 TaxID=2663237 RepID=UPI00129B42B4|nr:MarR family transcriptional regulator [Nocardia sp. SYP-A9097]MRH86053.1 helix-turn-helix domain-containing protein [Nocardia sp. SYP-A9097]
MAEPQPASGQAQPVSAEELRQLQAVVPMISSHFKRAKSDMSPTLRDAFESDGLGPRHGAALAYALSAGPIGVGELARQLGIGMTNASQLTGDLARAGWLRRDSDPADHRRTLLSVPDERRDEVTEFIARRSDRLLRAMTRLTPEQRAGFIAGLNAWAEALAE